MTTLPIVRIRRVWPYVINPAEVQKLLTKDTENLKVTDSLTFQLETLTAAYKDVKLEASKLKDEVDKLNVCHCPTLFE